MASSSTTRDISIQEISDRLMDGSDEYVLLQTIKDYKVNKDADVLQIQDIHTSDGSLSDISDFIQPAFISFLALSIAAVLNFGMTNQSLFSVDSFRRIRNTLVHLKRNQIDTPQIDPEILDYLDSSSIEYLCFTEVLQEIKGVIGSDLSVNQLIVKRLCDPEGSELRIIFEAQTDKKRHDERKTLRKQMTKAIDRAINNIIAEENEQKKTFLDLRVIFSPSVVSK